MFSKSLFQINKSHFPLKKIKTLELKDKYVLLN